MIFRSLAAFLMFLAFYPVGSGSGFLCEGGITSDFGYFLLDCVVPDSWGASSFSKVVETELIRTDASG